MNTGNVASSTRVYTFYMVTTTTGKESPTSSLRELDVPRFLLSLPFPSPPYICKYIYIYIYIFPASLSFLFSLRFLLSVSQVVDVSHFVGAPKEDVFSFVHEGAEGSRLGFSEVGQHLAVQPDVLSPETRRQPGVGKTPLAACGVDAANPEHAVPPLTLSAHYIRVKQRLHRAHASDLDAVPRSAAKAANHLENNVPRDLHAADERRKDEDGKREKRERGGRGNRSETLCPFRGDKEEAHRSRKKRRRGEGDGKKSARDNERRRYGGEIRQKSDSVLRGGRIFLSRPAVLFCLR